MVEFYEPEFIHRMGNPWKMYTKIDCLSESADDN